MADATENPDACSRCGTTREHLHVFESRPGVPFCAGCAAEMLAAGGMNPEKTIADELREAAARGREHLLSHVVAEVLPQTAIVALCGSVHEESAVMCRNCVMFDVKDRVLAGIVATLINAREPLASWLEEYARWAKDSIFVYDEEEGTPVHESDCDGEIGKNCRCFDHALAVARALNGTAEVAVR